MQSRMSLEGALRKNAGMLTSSGTLVARLGAACQLVLAYERLRHRELARGPGFPPASQWEGDFWRAVDLLVSDGVKWSQADESSRLGSRTVGGLSPDLTPELFVAALGALEHLEQIGTKQPMRTQWAAGGFAE